MWRTFCIVLAGLLSSIVPFIVARELKNIPSFGILPFASIVAILFLAWAVSKKYKVLSVICSLAFLAFFCFDFYNLRVNKDVLWDWTCIPCLICVVVVLLLATRARGFKIVHVSAGLFALVFVHVSILQFFPAFFTLRFPVAIFLDRSSVVEVQKIGLSKEFKKKYFNEKLKKVSLDFFDSTRTNVFVLVESWGTPTNMDSLDANFAFFDGMLQKSGVIHRRFSVTVAAEQADLIYRQVRVKGRGMITETFPYHLDSLGVYSAYFYAGDSTDLNRNKKMEQFGFKDYFYGSGKMSDAGVAAKIDSLLTDFANRNEKLFVAWTTSETRFPMIEAANIYKVPAARVDSAYVYRLNISLRQVADLARKHPEARFIVRGDHDPILSPVEFQKRFYKRWVPFVILN